MWLMVPAAAAAAKQAVKYSVATKHSSSTTRIAGNALQHCSKLQKHLIHMD